MDRQLANIPLFAGLEEHELAYELTDVTKLTVGIRYSDETKEQQARLYYFDLASAFDAPFKEQKQDWQEITGKIGLDHDANLSFTDHTLLYATIARGYKGGGFNTPSPIVGAYPDTFEPEYINSIEIGAKNRLFDNRLQANLSAFYYDYKGLQIAKIINQSSVITNSDATVGGVELEFMLAPNANWLLSLNLAYLDTEIGNFQDFDPADPTQGGPLINVFGSIVPLGATGPIAPTVVDLEGNRLPNSPEFSINAFVDYTQVLGNGMNIVYHLDYFWQDEYYSRNFNTDADRIDSWSVSNATITLYSASQDWYIKAWAKNLQDDDNITGHYTTDQVAGLYTNAFILEPRTYGLTFGTYF